MSKKTNAATLTLTIRITGEIQKRIEAATKRRVAERGLCAISDAARELLLMGLDRDEIGK